MHMTRRLSRVLALAACSCCFVACEAVSTNEDALNREPVGKVSAGIRPLANPVLSAQPVGVLFYLNNGTDSPIEVLPWSTPMEQTLTADVFVVSRDGEVLPYGGRVVKRAPPGPDDYLTLAAGEKRETVVNVSDGYNTTAAGEYTVVLKAPAFLSQTGSYIEPVLIEDTVVVSRQ